MTLREASLENNPIFRIDPTEIRSARPHHDMSKYNWRLNIELPLQGSVTTPLLYIQTVVLQLMSSLFKDRRV